MHSEMVQDPVYTARQKRIQFFGWFSIGLGGLFAYAGEVGSFAKENPHAATPTVQYYRALQTVVSCLDQHQSFIQDPVHGTSLTALVTELSSQLETMKKEEVVMNYEAFVQASHARKRLFVNIGSLFSLASLGVMLYFLSRNKPKYSYESIASNGPSLIA